MRNNNRITFLRDNKLNYNGSLYEYSVVDGVLTFSDKQIHLVNDKLSGWEALVPSHDPYFPDEWQKFLFMFFPRKYCGEKTYSKAELDTPVWNEWKKYYLNENPCGLDSPRSRNELRLSSSPIRIKMSPRRISEQFSPIYPSSPLASPRNSDRARPIRLNSSPGRCQSPQRDK